MITHFIFCQSANTFSCKCNLQLWVMDLSSVLTWCTLMDETVEFLRVFCTQRSWNSLHWSFTQHIMLPCVDCSLQLMAVWRRCLMHSLELHQPNPKLLSVPPYSVLSLHSLCISFPIITHELHLKKKQQKKRIWFHFLTGFYFIVSLFPFSSYLPHFLFHFFIAAFYTYSVFFLHFGFNIVQINWT